MDTIIISAFIAALLLSAVYVLARFWQFTLGVLATMLLAVSCSKAGTLEVAAIIESEADRNAMMDAVSVADTIVSPLGLDIVVTYIEVGEVAAHTHAGFLLEAVKSHRVDSALHRNADATVLFTRRDIKMGATDYTGIATVGPACSAAASAIVEMRNDGNDGAILAHELLHTLGVPHDDGLGWVMSEGLGRHMSYGISPDTELTFRAAGTECLNAPAVIPPAAVQAPAAPFSSDESSGGGGSFDWLLALLLAPLAMFRKGVK